ncbi:RNA pseudouridine synthase [Candidatus Velamenicoccus archaeovorus]|uniref:RNA pseudouridine synthase n=2 Tax=Velamenicoccus archaeovorus TaxID=1930593 RepID=A0A410P7I6_VELA1|nr:RNA pseudouridine synthase [Candidatus Velamenicoccus archaeovorus]
MQKDHLKGIKIVYEDRDILVVDKPPKLLTMASNTEKERTAYHILTDYVRKGCAASRNRIFIVHRLDRDTSGIVIFAKNERAKNSLQQQWDQTEKKYLAVVYGSFPQKSGEITSYLAENAAHIVFSTRDRSIGKLSTTIYKTLKETKGFSLLEVDLATGRKNQIRVHFAEKGHPIVGDRKYGGRDAMHKRMALHAYSISFLHPWNGRRMILKTPVPAYFTELVGDFTL